MRTDFGEHLFTGVVIFFLLIFILGVPPGFELPLCGAFFILGALMPDLDSPSSKPRKFMRKAVFLLALVLLLLFYPQFSAECNRLAGGSTCVYLPVLSILLVFAAVYFLDFIIPRHRGFLHGFSAAFLYGAAVCLLLLYTGAGVSSFIIGAWAFGGYLSHLAVDFVGDAAPFK
ncbi:metal-dependent hydrolase [Candidatus Micrarchaeota archaeon]|nr:metal-dependent hydrolase [Candidatus Micrarchaeota archaeon]